MNQFTVYKVPHFRRYLFFYFKYRAAFYWRKQRWRLVLDIEWGKNVEGVGMRDNIYTEEMGVKDMGL